MTVAMHRSSSALGRRLAAGVAVVSAGVFLGEASVSSLTQSHWSPSLESQIPAVVSAWLALSGLAWLIARVSGFEIRVVFSSVAFIGAVACAGLVVSTAVLIFMADALLIGAFVRQPAAGDHGFERDVPVGIAVIGLASNVVEFVSVTNRVTVGLAAFLPLLLLVDGRTFAYVRSSILHVAGTISRCGSGRPSIVSAFLMVLVFGALLLHFLFVLQPERYYDALAVHLYVPSYVVSHGRWSFDANDWAFAHMPLTVDFIYTWLFVSAGEGAPRLYNFVALLLIARVLYVWLRETCGFGSSLTAALLFLTTPLAFIETASLFIENTVTLWCVVATWIVASKRETWTAGHVRQASVLLGAIVAAKLHGVLIALLVSPFILLDLLALVRRGERWGSAVATLLISLALCTVPYAYSWIDTGNPVFPFFNGLFKSPLWSPSNFVDTRWTGHLDWLLLWRATFQSSRYIEGYNGVLGLSLLVLLPLACALAGFRRHTVDLIALGIGLGYIVLAGTQIQYLRYFFFVVPLLFFLIGRMMNWVGQSVGGRISISAVALACALWGVFLVPSAGWVLGASDFVADFDQTRRRELVASQVPERLANQLINDLAGKDAIVFYTGSPFPALLEGTGLASNWYNTKFAAAIQSVKSPGDVGDLLRRMDVRYVVLGADPDSAVRNLTLEYAQANGRLVSTQGPLQIYDLKAK